MKANRKFLNNDEEAVSPVIAVILMVAITVVLAATVYVWVSGFSGQNTAAAGSLSMAQVATLPTAGASPQTNGLKFTVTSVSPGFQVGNLKILDTSSGYAWNTIDYAAGALTGNDFSVLDDGSATPLATSTSVIGAGDVINMFIPATSNLAAGHTLQFVDTNSNSVIASLVVR